MTLLACVLVPVDVFLISYMKNPDGEKSLHSMHQNKWSALEMVSRSVLLRSSFGRVWLYGYHWHWTFSILHFCSSICCINVNSKIHRNFTCLSMFYQCFGCGSPDSDSIGSLVLHLGPCRKNESQKQEKGKNVFSEVPDVLSWGLEASTCTSVWNPSSWPTNKYNVIFI